MQRIRNFIADHKRWVIGISLLVVVVFIWVLSSNLMQYIFVDSFYPKPFFLTYFSTSLFSVYLWGFVFFPSWRNRARGVATESDETKETWKKLNEEEASPSATVPSSAVSTPDTPLKDALIMEDAMDNHGTRDKLDDDETTSLKADIEQPPVNSSSEEDSPPEPLSVWEIAKLSATFCVVWFLANWSYNGSLVHTSVSSNTIISTTSSFFTLAFTHVMGLERFTLVRFGAVLLTFGGVTLVTLVDRDEGTRGVLGDILALVSAVFYGAYCSLLKYKIKDENQVNMPMFFGYVGIFNMVVMLPGLIILHFTGIEPFEAPSLQIVLYLTANGLIGTVVSDLLWSMSIFYTNALVGTLGLSLTVPLAIVIDLIRKKKEFNFAFIIGGALVVTGFLVKFSWEDRIYSKVKQVVCCKSQSEIAEEDVAPSKHH